MDPCRLVGPENLEDLDFLEPSNGLFGHLGKEEVYPLLVDCERDEIRKLQGQTSSSHGLVQQELRIVFHEDRLVNFFELDVAPVDFQDFVCRFVAGQLLFARRTAAWRNVAELFGLCLVNHGVEKGVPGLHCLGYIRPGYFSRRAWSRELRSARGTGLTASLVTSKRFFELAVMNT